VSAPYDLDRFVRAQQQTYDVALGEVRAGAKRSHWMWFVFPQIAGLGHSPMARRYAIAHLAEAEAFLAHPVLGGRLREITGALLELAHADADRVFGDIDSLKLRSSLTLFARADPEPDSVFRQALDRWFGGDVDKATVERL